MLMLNIRSYPSSSTELPGYNDMLDLSNMSIKNVVGNVKVRVFYNDIKSHIGKDL